jgi:hypothetical protein
MPHFIEISTAFSFAVQSSIIIMIWATQNHSHSSTSSSPYSYPFWNIIPLQSLLFTESRFLRYPAEWTVRFHTLVLLHLYIFLFYQLP